jgi:hypothetical protein
LRGIKRRRRKMKTIWKFALNDPEAKVEMPKGAEILAVQTQWNTPCVWALVDPVQPKETRQFRTYGTGHVLPENPGKYLGTFQVRSGIFIFHVFEV